MRQIFIFHFSLFQFLGLKSDDIVVCSIQYSLSQSEWQTDLFTVPIPSGQSRYFFLLEKTVPMSRYLLKSVPINFKLSSIVPYYRSGLSREDVQVLDKAT